MTTPYKDFDAAVAEVREVVLRFKIGGEEFAIDQAIPAIPIIELAGMNEQSGVEAVMAFKDFLVEIVGPAEWPRLKRALAGKGFEDLLAIVAWLVEEATGRPTQPPSPSPAPVEPAGPASKVVSLQAGTVTPMPVETIEALEAHGTAEYSAP